MYNTFWDTRCLPQDVPEHGEYAGYTELFSRIRLKQFIQDLPTKINVREALESEASAPVTAGSAGVESYYMPQINEDALLDFNTQLATTDWLAWAGMSGGNRKIDYKNLYQVTTLYGRIMPSDFGMTGVPAPNTPQVWKMVIVNNQVVVHFERLTNVHGMIPMFFCQPLVDGLGYQTKSFATNLTPIQSITTALANSSISIRRRALADRMLYDPSRVSAAALNNPSPTAKIAVRPSAYQDDLSKAIYPIPYQDGLFQSNTMEIQQYLSLADRISGMNQARQGQFVKGNKTRTEYADIMSYANGRDETIAISLESNFFSPIKEILKINILQYQIPTTVYNPELEDSVRVDPIALRKAALTMKVSDGKLPSDKLIDGESMSLAFQTMASVPQLSSGYNMVPMFSYLMKSRGAKLQPFEKSQAQLAYEQALATWQQAAQQIAAMLQQNQDPENPMQPEDLQKLLEANPMPTPEQFGYEPNKPKLSQGNPLGDNNPSIMEQISGTVANAAQNSQGIKGMGQQ